MLYDDFILLNDIEKSEILLSISDKVCKELKNNFDIYPVVSEALLLSRDFISKKFQSIDACELSVYLNNLDEKFDLGMLTYNVKSQKEQLALDIIIYTVGFIARIAHKKTNTKELMPDPVSEAEIDTVYQVFELYSNI